MVTRPLSENDLAFGRAILLATDTLGMSAEGAFWLYDSDDKEWRYFLVTSLYGQIGPRGIYLRLNEALTKKLSEHEMSDFMIYLVSPNDGLAKSFRKVRTSPHASEATQFLVKIDDHTERAVVYRMAPPLGQKETKLAGRRFSKRSRELAAA